MLLDTLAPLPPASTSASNLDRSASDLGIWGSEAATQEAPDFAAPRRAGGSTVPRTLVGPLPVTPRRGRLLVFPHVCPHEGRAVLDIPKLLLRGELI